MDEHPLAAEFEDQIVSLLREYEQQKGYANPLFVVGLILIAFGRIQLARTQVFLS